MYRFPVANCFPTAEGVECRLTVSTDCPFFEGHFPGRPILPAVAQLLLVAQIYDRAVEGDVCMSGVTLLRLLRPITPGDALQVEITHGGPERKSRFAIAGDDLIHSQGIVTWAPRGS